MSSFISSSGLAYLWGKIKEYISAHAGTYSKPSGGIPKSDLASAVQTSLGKADTALQSYTETDPVFAASAAHGITSSDISNWNSKVDTSGTGATGTWDISIEGSAKSLTTSRYIWGQSFNGTASVKGTLYMISDDESATTNSSSAKLKFNSASADSSTVQHSPYIQAIGSSSYGRKRLSIFQSNVQDYTDNFTEAVTILPDGNVGINNSSPSNALDINGTLGVSGAAAFASTVDITGNITASSGVYLSNGKAIYINDTGGTMRNALFMSSSSNTLNVGYGMTQSGAATNINGNTVSINYGGSRTTGLYVSSTGNIGIGTTSPAYKLDVNGNAAISGTLYLGGNPVAVVYSGSTAPSSSTGSDGDIYIQTS